MHRFKKIPLRALRISLRTLREKTNLTISRKVPQSFRKVKSKFQKKRAE